MAIDWLTLALVVPLVVGKRFEITYNSLQHVDGRNTNRTRCLALVTDTSGVVRETSCRTLPAHLPFGEPFVISTEPGDAACDQVANDLRQHCFLASSQVTATPAETSMNDVFLFPDAFKRMKMYYHAQDGGSCLQHARDLRMPDSWSLYRLADTSRAFCDLHPFVCAFCENPASECSKNCSVSPLYLPVGSLALHVSSLCQHGLTWVEALDLAIDKRKKCAPVEAPPPGALVVHLRVGDVIDATNYTTSDLLTEQRRFYADPMSVYVKPLSFFDTFVESSFLRNRTVILVASATVGEHVSATPPLPSKSCMYIHIRRYFWSRGAGHVQLRLGNLPDDDILYMSMADFFLPSGGGFSRLPAYFVEKRGGTILETENSRGLNNWWSDYFDINETRNTRDLSALYELLGPIVDDKLRCPQ